MAKINFNKLNFNQPKIGPERKIQMNKNLFAGGNILPKPVTYNEIHDDIIRFIKEDLSIDYNGNKLPAFFLTQQRFSEFSKTWEYVDENKNIQSNFIVITRENNPKKGTQQQDYANIPGNSFYTIGTAEKWDGNKNITISYKMRQPYTVDFIYNIKLISNKIDLLNLVNNKILDKFKANQAYICPNGHYMPVKLEDVSDESDYELDERKIFIQTFQLLIKGYIINESDLLIEENICASVVGFELDVKSLGNIPVDTIGNLIVEFPINSKNVLKIKSSDYYSITNVITDNVDSYVIKINGLIVGSDFSLNKYDKIEIKIVKTDPTKVSQITLSTQIIIPVVLSDADILRAIRDANPQSTQLAALFDDSKDPHTEWWDNNRNQGAILGDNPILIQLASQRGLILPEILLPNKCYILALSYDSVESLEISGLSELIYLQPSYNENLQAINFNSLSKIQCLYWDGNPVGTYIFNNLNELRVLSFDDCGIENINVLELNVLESLTLSDNLILELDITGLSLLNNLVCRACSLSNSSIESIFNNFVSFNTQNGFISISDGTNAYYSTWSDQAKADYGTLILRGWNIQYNNDAP